MVVACSPATLLVSLGNYIVRVWEAYRNPKASVAISGLLSLAPISESSASIKDVSKIFCSFTLSINSVTQFMVDSRSRALLCAGRFNHGIGSPAQFPSLVLITAL